MGELLRGKTIKAKLIFYNFIIVSIISIVFSINSYISANKRTISIAKNSMKHRVESISYRYEMAYEELLNIILVCSERKNFDLRELENPITAETKSRGLEYSQNIRDFCAVTGYSEYIVQMSVFNDKGVLIQTSKYGSHDDYQRLANASWFMNELQKPMGAYQLDLVESPLFRGEPMILPIAAALVGMDGKPDGWVMISLSTKLYEDVLRELAQTEETVVVTIDGSRIAAINEETASIEENNQILADLLKHPEHQGLFEMVVHGQKSLVAYERYFKSGILVYQVIPMASLKSDINVVAQTAMVTFIACLILGMFLSLIFTSMVRKPIDRLVRLIQTIAKGEFVQDLSVESEDEIGTIGKVVNSMSGRIEDLLEQRVQDEKEKSDLELRMLQAQINPHFLYNTLDSIRWIAVMQKNSGIVKMVTALSGLLKNMAKGFNEKVTLATELEFLEDYVTIAKVKYLELFDVEIDITDSLLYQAKVIKLTLQPLVENAIFSGIEPSGRVGIIQIRAFSENGVLILTVRDNGCGIPSEMLQTLLSQENPIQEKGRMSGIGLANVDKRIKLTYGEIFGLTIDSVEHEYTIITIRQPLEFD